MLDNIVLSHIVLKLQTLISRIKRLCNKDKKAKKTGKEECKQSKIITNIVAIICVICVLSAAAVIGAWLWNFILGVGLIFNKESYPQKRTYEIVQNNTYPELNTTSGQVASATNFQVVILHRGSQVLLMNGKIDGNETINPQEDMSSSNLVIDTKSYEFQEASQYRFYRKEFKNVTPDPPPQND